MSEAWPDLRVNGTFPDFYPDQMLRQIKLQPSKTQLKILILEDQMIERIFYFIAECTNLVAVFFSGNRIITRDLPYIVKLDKLVKADLSKNRIHFLPHQLRKLERLQFLMLDHNELCGQEQLELIVQVTSLKLLTLHNNPCTKIYGSRTFIISRMPKLWALDNTIVIDNERKNITYNLKHLKLTCFIPKKYEFFMKSYHNLQNKTEAEVNYALRMELYFLRRAFERTSPVLTIQKWTRMCLKRWRYINRKHAIRYLYYIFDKCHKR